MNKVKVEINKKGIIELLKSEDLEKILMQYGNRISNRAGKGYQANIVHSSDRSKVFVKAKTKKAKQDNFENNTLLKALR